MTITVKSGYWNDSYTFTKGKSPLRGRINKLFRKRSNKVDQELLVELTGTAPGAAAAASYSRVAGNGATAGNPTDVGELGGVRTIETRTLIDRDTVTADATQLDTLVTYAPKPSTYPGDASGNGK